MRVCNAAADGESCGLCERVCQRLRFRQRGGQRLRFGERRCLGVRDAYCLRLGLRLCLDKSRLGHGRRVAVG